MVYFLLFQIILPDVRSLSTKSQGKSKVIKCVLKALLSVFQKLWLSFSWGFPIVCLV